MGDVEITLFTIAFQGFFYLIGMLLANVFYSFGPWIERFVKQECVNNYRIVAYNAGFWGSVLLPCGIPLLLLFLVTFFPGYLTNYPAKHRQAFHRLDLSVGE